MLDWLKGRVWRREREAPERVVRPPQRVVSGKYQLLQSTWTSVLPAPSS